MKKTFIEWIYYYAPVTYLDNFILGWKNNPNQADVFIGVNRRIQPLSGPFYGAIGYPAKT